MILTGVIVNTIAIVVGAILGQVFSNLKQEMKETILKAIGIVIILLGLQMAFQVNEILIVLFSLALGGVLGEWLNIEQRLESAGKWIERKAGKRLKGNVSQAFVTTTLIYCIGAMAVVGSLDSGLRQEHDVLYTKAFLDGFTAIIFSSTLGIGVMFSAIPVFLYQGAIAFGATFIQYVLSPELIDKLIVDLTATGGILIVAIGLNMLEIVKIRIGNLLPALLVSAILTLIYHYIQL
ncbi:DUF554 domain-containing protein [Bacillus horti]|uniref:Membrane protein YqgA involved in biofilm formation n=1 Tax=Caldalkalibacillus horti TaxID=77523 RepID=A0ABT9W1K7_9BACI|nr:DUF554 domain-containing protein [Bacillus horti]MDQ0167116.1 putative membrane protein YqgA involved in biofilm formation [Bacillus horti]